MNNRTEVKLNNNEYLGFRNLFYVSRILPFIMIETLFYIIFSALLTKYDAVNGRQFSMRVPEIQRSFDDTLPQRHTKTASYPDTISQDNLLKAVVSRSDSLIWIRGDIKKDYRIFGYQSPSTKSKPLILFSVFTRDVTDNPYNCKYGAYYSTSDLAFEDTRIKFRGFDGKFALAQFIIEGNVADTFYFERKWLTFIK